LVAGGEGEGGILCDDQQHGSSISVPLCFSETFQSDLIILIAVRRTTHRLRETKKEESSKEREAKEREDPAEVMLSASDGRPISKLQLEGVLCKHTRCMCKHVGCIWMYMSFTFVYGIQDDVIVYKTTPGAGTVQRCDICY
jgi:hypothetical protein